MVDERCVEFFNIIGALLPLRLPLRTNYTNSWNTVSWCYHRSQVSLKFGVVFKILWFNTPTIWMKYANSDGHPLIMDGVAIMGGECKARPLRKSRGVSIQNSKAYKVLICIYILSRRGFIPTFIHPIMYFFQQRCLQIFYHHCLAPCIIFHVRSCGRL